MIAPSLDLDRKHLVTERRSVLSLAGREVIAMNVACLEGQLQASIRMVNSAREVCSRGAHAGLVNAYRVLIERGRLRIVMEDVFVRGPVFPPTQQGKFPSSADNDVTAYRSKQASRT